MLESFVSKRNEKKKSTNTKSIIVRARMPDFKKLTRQVEERRRSFERVRQPAAVYKDKKREGLGDVPMTTIELLSDNVMTINLL